MAEPFADSEYYEDNFGAPPARIADRLDEELARASRYLRAETKRHGIDIDQEIEAGEIDPDLAADITCEMVATAGASPGGVGVASIQAGAGPFQTTQTFTNTVGDLYVSKKQLGLLGIGGRMASVALSSEQTGKYRTT